MKILDRSRPPVSILDFPPDEIRNFLRQKLAAKGVHEAYIFGSFADLQDLGVPIDLLIYTPAEFAGMQADPTPFWKAFQRRNIRIL